MIKAETFSLFDFLTFFNNFVSITRILDGHHWQGAGEVEKTASLFSFWTRVGGFVNWTRFARPCVRPLMGEDNACCHTHMIVW